MKKYYFVNTLASCVMTAMTLMTPVSAFDKAELKSEPIDLYVNESTIYTGDMLPENINEYLIGNGIEVSSDAQVSIEYCATENQTDISAVLLSVYDEIEDNGTRIAENTASLTVLNEPMDVTAMRASLESWNASFPPAEWNSRLSITAYARRYVYSVNGYTCYRPHNCSASCTYTAKPQYFEVSYICDGFTVDLNTGELGDEDVHVITVSKSSPTSGQNYVKTNAYTSGVGLYTFSGSPAVGEFLTFAYRYSGEDRREYTVHT